MSKRNVLVTGAAGILGSHFCEALHDAGYNVHALIRETSSRKWIDHDWFTVHIGSLFDSSYLLPLFKKMDVIIHNAGVNHGSPAELCRKVNVDATRTVAQAAVKAGVKRFIYISSRSAAGPNTSMWRTEDDADDPHEPYGQSKKAAEELLYELKEDIEVISLRYALMYGPRDTHLFPVFKMLTFFIHPVPGRRAIYTPLLYLKDAARAVVSVVRARKDSFQSGSVYYVSDGIPYSMETMYDLILTGMKHKSWRIRIPLWVLSIAAWLANKVIKSNQEFTPDGVREMKAGSRLVSPARFMEDFNWLPQVPPQQAFSETVDWYRKQGWLKH